MTARLMTAEQLCEAFGIPSTRTVRTMRQQGLAGVRLGKQYLFDPADVRRFIEAKKECPAPTEARVSTGSQRGASSTSSNMSAAPSGSVARAQQIAARLKKPSPTTSGQVIGMQPARENRAN